MQKTANKCEQMKKFLQGTHIFTGNIGLQALYDAPEFTIQEPHQIRHTFSGSNEDGSQNIYTIQLIPQHIENVFPFTKAPGDGYEVTTLQYWAKPTPGTEDGVNFYLSCDLTKTETSWISVQFNDEYCVNLTDQLFHFKYARTCPPIVAQWFRERDGQTLPISFTFHRDKKPTDALTYF